MYDYDYFRFEDDPIYDEIDYEGATYDDMPEILDPANQFYCPYIQFYAFHPPMYMPNMSRQQPHHRLPPGPPPAHTPSKKNASTTKSSLKPCLFKYTHIWPKRGNPFWAWITYVERNTISGYRWYRNRWAYFGMNIKQIDNFICQ